MSFEIRTTKFRIPQITVAVHAALAAAVDAGCKDVEALAIEKAPVDTGHLKGSITGKPDAPGALTGTVSVGADYGIDQEFGTHKMAAHPFLRPAMETGAEAFFEDVGNAVDEASK